jgi:hypothetical protein
MGIGLLIGTERERNKGTGPARSSSGIRAARVHTVGSPDRAQHRDVWIQRAGLVDTTLKVIAGHLKPDGTVGWGAWRVMIRR